MDHKKPNLKTLLPSNEDLMLSAKTGSQEAFLQLYERFFPTVSAWTRFKIPEAEVEDVTQEIFIAVLKSLGSFRNQSKVSTWIWTITNRKIADYYRARKLKQPVELDRYDELDAESLAAQAGSTESEQDNWASVRQALGSLPTNYQDVILLRFVYEMPFNEIAEKNGQSLEATKSLFRRAMDALSMKMENQHE